MNLISAKKRAEQQPLPANYPLRPKHEPRKLRVTGKVRQAINAMVWQGLKRDEAAEHAGLQPHSLYVAFRLPHVKQAYLKELEVLRTSERARNVHTLLDVRESENQVARIQAVRTLEEMDDENIPNRRGIQAIPGVTVVIQAAPDKVSVSPIIDLTADVKPDVP